MMLDEPTAPVVSKRKSGTAGKKQPAPAPKDFDLFEDDADDDGGDVATTSKRRRHGLCCCHISTEVLITRLMWMPRILLCGKLFHNCVSLDMSPRCGRGRRRLNVCFYQGWKISRFKITNVYHYRLLT